MFEDTRKPLASEPIYPGQQPLYLLEYCSSAYLPILPQIAQSL
jgi:hypothetical protein